MGLGGSAVRRGYRSIPSPRLLKSREIGSAFIRFRVSDMAAAIRGVTCGYRPGQRGRRQGYRQQRSRSMGQAPGLPTGERHTAGAGSRVLASRWNCKDCRIKA